MTETEFKEGVQAVYDWLYRVSDIIKQKSALPDPFDTKYRTVNSFNEMIVHLYHKADKVNKHRIYWIWPEIAEAIRQWEELGDELFKMHQIGRFADPSSLEDGACRLDSEASDLVSV